MAGRIGLGFDSHRLVAGRPLVLGGVRIPHSKGLAGHSDADVLAHAVCDALLGAAALGDIGSHYPPSDERWRDADSMLLLAQVVAMVGKAGWRIGNIDATVIAEDPPLGPHRKAMRHALASACGIAPDQTEVKAKTAEGLGLIGAGEGMAAMAVALLLPARANVVE